MSEIDRDLIPSREEERPLKRALGSTIPEFTAPFGAAGAIKRVSSGIAARKARSLPDTTPSGALSLRKSTSAGMRAPYAVIGRRGALWVPAGGANPTKYKRGSATTASRGRQQAALRIRSPPVRPLKRQRRMRYGRRRAERKPA
jgi:hypothetical protein